MIATFVFSANADAKVHLDFSTTPRNYMKSVDNYLAWCVLDHNSFLFYAHALFLGYTKSTAHSMRHLGKQELVYNMKTSMRPEI